MPFFRKAKILQKRKEQVVYFVRANSRGLFIIYRDNRVGKIQLEFSGFSWPAHRIFKSSKPVPVTIIFFKTREAQIQTFSYGTIFNDLISDYFQQQNVVLKWELEYP